MTQVWCGVVTQITNTFRQKNIPCDVVWMDIDYMHGFKCFTFDEVRASTITPIFQSITHVEYSVYNFVWFQTCINWGFKPYFCYQRLEEQGGIRFMSWFWWLVLKRNPLHFCRTSSQIRRLFQTSCIPLALRGSGCLIPGSRQRKVGTFMTVELRWTLGFKLRMGRILLVCHCAGMVE